LSLHELQIPAGSYRVAIENLAGSVDWGLTLHPATWSFLSKSTAIDGGIAWENPGGVGEELLFDLAADGLYCLAVWKVGAGDLPASGDYRIVIEPQTVDASPSAAPARTALAAAWPNPVRTSLTVDFDLAREGEASLEVFDIAGARVRSLVHEPRPAGRHRAIWDLRDRSGRSVKAGIYHLRFSAPGATSIRKLVVVR
jgi:hypothetical protein